MTRSPRSITALSFLTVAILSAPFGWGRAAMASERPRAPQAEESFLPNYADRMLSPIKGMHIAPVLLATRTHLPIKVAIVDDGTFYREHWADTATEACQKWAKATSNLASGGLSFRYVRSSDPTGADIVIEFLGPHGYHGYDGFTTEHGDWARVSVAVAAVGGGDEKEATVRRVLTHEIGHALGIWGHSPDSHDIMSESESPVDVSLADVNTLRLAYAQRANR